MRHCATLRLTATHCQTQKDEIARLQLEVAANQARETSASSSTSAKVDAH